MGRTAPPEASQRRTPPERGPYVSIAEGGTYLGVSRWTMYRIVEADEVPCYLVGGYRKVAIADLDRYARRRRRTT